jgi:hypothetical protein
MMTTLREQVAESGGLEGKSQGEQLMLVLLHLGGDSVPKTAGEITDCVNRELSGLPGHVVVVPYGNTVGSLLGSSITSNYVMKMGTGVRTRYQLTERGVKRVKLVWKV